MNTIDQPPMEANGKGASEPYEDLLRGFFRAEMPEPWPAFQRPERAILTIPQAQPLGRNWFARSKSRLALAASVVILLVSSWLLSGALRDSKTATQPGVNTDRDIATQPNFIKPPADLLPKGR